jgi:hypothetical protein
MSKNDEWDALLGSLCAVTDRRGGAEFSRENILALLDLLVRHMEKPMAITDHSLDDGTLVLVEHPTVTLMRRLFRAIGDLDIGLTDDVFKPKPTGKYNTRPWRLRAQDQAVIDLIDVTYRLNGGTNRSKTINKLAREMRRRGYTRRGKSVSPSQMQKLWNKYSKQ